MKFQCDRCKTRYSIADEKVRGKVLKIRCKNCASIITVREGGAAEMKPSAAAPAPAKPVLPQPSAVRTPRPQAPVLAKAFEKAMTAPLPPSYDPGLEDEETRVGDPPLVLLDEWYLSVDGGQDGPLTLPQAQQKVSEMPPGEEVFAWRDGLDDWLPVEKVPELAGHLRKKPARRMSAPMPAAAAPVRYPAGPVARTPAPLAATATPKAAAGPSLSKTIAGIGPDTQARTPSVMDDQNTPIPLAELAAAASGLATGVGGVEGGDNGQPKRPSGEFDFVVGEPSQMVQLSTLAKGLTKDPPGVTRTTRMPGATPVAVPGMANGQLAVGRGTGGASALATGVAPTIGGTPALMPTRRRSGGLIIGLGVLATAAVGGVILFLAFRHRAGTDDDPLAPSGRTSGGSEVIDNFYQGGGGLPGANAPSGAMKPAGDPNAPIDDKTRPNRTGVRMSPGGGTRPMPAGGKQDLFPADDPEQVTVDDILDKGKIANPAMKQCYNHALKSDPMLKLTRMDLRITVGTSGLVTDVRALTNGTKSKFLTDCLIGIVKSWRFHRSNEGLTADLPIIFSNG